MMHTKPKHSVLCVGSEHECQEAIGEKKSSDDADMAVASMHRRISLLAPEMARWGGVQSYMWRIWELLDVVTEEGAQGWSLNDSESALRKWPHTSAARPIGYSRNRLALMKSVLTGVRGEQVLIVGHVNLAPLAYLRKLIDPKVRYLVVLHGIEAWKRMHIFQRMALKYADAVVTTTNFTRDECVRVNQLTGKNFHVIPLCLPEVVTTPAGDSVLGGNWPLLYVGRLARTERRKGLETCMEAVHMLRKQGIDVELHVVGEGDDRERLEDLSCVQGLAESGVYFHGALDRAELDGCYQDAKLLLMPSEKEGFGLVFLEAMRHGVPCVGGRHGGTPEVFRDGEEGFLVQYGNVEQLTDVIAELYFDPNRFCATAAAARRRFETDYRFSVFVRRWRDLLQKVACI